MISANVNYFFLQKYAVVACRLLPHFFALETEHQKRIFDALTLMVVYARYYIDVGTLIKMKMNLFIS